MKKLPSINGWYLEINSLEDLLLYWMTMKLKLDGNALAEAASERLYHCRSELANRFQSLTKMTGISLAGAMQKMSGKSFQSQSKLILNGETIYINKNSGYFTGKREYKILKTQKIDKFLKNTLFPKPEGQYTEKDIRILKWDGGTHYYAKIDNLDVVVGRCQKWNTEVEAREKAKEFLQGLIT